MLLMVPAVLPPPPPCPEGCLPDVTTSPSNGVCAHICDVRPAISLYVQHQAAAACEVKVVCDVCYLAGCHTVASSLYVCIIALLQCHTA
jgi:hypothetical protein